MGAPNIDTTANVFLVGKRVQNLCAFVVPHCKHVDVDALIETGLLRRKTKSNKFIIIICFL